MQRVGSLRLNGFFAAIALAALVLPGCSGHDRPSWASLDPDDWANRRISDEPLLFELAGPISVDVGSFAGDVSIEADADLAQGEVTIVREAVHGFGRSKDAKASLADITASAELVAADTSRGELGQTLRIRAESANVESYLQRAHIHVRAPEIDGLTVRTDDGNVAIKHVQGHVDVESSNGRISVRTNLPMTSPVVIINKNGDIDFRAGKGTAGAFDAQTINGRASADIRFGAMMLQPVTRDDVFQASLNGGTNAIVLRTTNGDIRIAVLAENEKTVILPSGRKPPKEKPAEPKPEESAVVEEQ
jgi:hypothetical protein